jgi:hypothetical protein
MQRYFNLDLSEQEMVMSQEDLEALRNQSAPRLGSGSTTADWTFNFKTEDDFLNELNFSEGFS